MGFEVVIPPGLMDANGYLAGTDPHRAHFINQLFADNRIDAIICARGGYGSMRILELLDYQLISENPKIFIGFSDITVLLTVLTDRCGLATFHGPVVTSLADAPAQTRNSLLQTLISADKLEIRANGGLTIHSGQSTGMVCGGNLTTLCHLVGTPYEPNFTDKVLFLEDRAEAPYRIDRMLTHMKLAGCFDNLAGIALGSFEDCGPPDDVCNIVAECFRDESIPIFAGLEVGHAEINLTLPFGIEATLDAANHMLSFHRAATAAPEER
jgi:muramoyltetrapeptide carboxypeptidase